MRLHLLDARTSTREPLRRRASASSAFSAAPGGGLRSLVAERASTSASAAPSHASFAAWSGARLGTFLLRGGGRGDAALRRQTRALLLSPAIQSLSAYPAHC